MRKLLALVGLLGVLGFGTVTSAAEQAKPVAGEVCTLKVQGMT